MDPIQYLQPAVNSVLEAGKIVLEIYHSDFKVRDKGKNDPVTEADLKAGIHITEKLRFSNIPVLSEEDSEKRISPNLPRLGSWIRSTGLENLYIKIRSLRSVWDFPSVVGRFSG